MTAKGITTIELTYNLAHELLDVNFDTGVLTWKKRDNKWFKYNHSFNTWNTRFANKEAGYIFIDRSGKKYRAIYILRKRYLLHRVIFFMRFGYWPIEIDHADGNGLNNMINNIRGVTSSDNGKNRRLYSNNKTGISGVHCDRQIPKWTARIRVNGKYKGLGIFDDFFEACCVRKSAEIMYGYHKNHGIDRPL